MAVVETHASGAASSRTPLDRDARLARNLLLVMSGWCVLAQAFTTDHAKAIEHVAGLTIGLSPFMFIQAAFFLALAVVVGTGRRRTPLAPTIGGGLIVLYSLPHIVADLGHPGDDGGAFVWTLIALPQSSAHVARGPWCGGQVTVAHVAATLAWC